MGKDEVLLEERALLELTLLDAARLEAGWLDDGLDNVDELVAVLDGLPESELPPPQAERIKVKPRPYMQVLRCVKGIISALSYVYYGCAFSHTDHDVIGYVKVYPVFNAARKHFWLFM